MIEEWKVATAYTKKGFLIEVTNEDWKINSIAAEVGPGNLYVSSHSTEQAAIRFVKQLKGYEPGWEKGNVTYG